MQSDSTSRTSFLKSSEETAVSSSLGKLKSCSFLVSRNHDSLPYSRACRLHVNQSPMQMSLVDTHWKQSQRDSHPSARSSYIVSCQCQKERVMHLFSH
eukprot:5530998-Amphidinium_carterae.1